MKIRAFTPLIVLAAAVAVAAPSFASASSAWSKSAVTICKKAHAEGNKAVPGDPKTTRALLAANEKLLSIDVRLMASLDKLPRPAASKAEITRLLSYYHQELVTIKKLVIALKANKPALAQKLAAQDTVFKEKAIPLEEKLGLGEWCNL
jgi:hypothetical protein